MAANTEAWRARPVRGNTNFSDPDAANACSLERTQDSDAISSRISSSSSPFFPFLIDRVDCRNQGSSWIHGGSFLHVRCVKIATRDVDDTVETEGDAAYRDLRAAKAGGPSNIGCGIIA